ncbi:MAG: thioredoxin fold domain-containing protein [Planctomycetes bacterium]|nr:thioredoxin fold domain-containing protein [Planctomycetota bacterium]
MERRSALAVLPLSLALAAASSAQAGAPDFAAGTLTEIRERATAAGLGVVIDFSTDACAPCRRLMAETWSDAELWQWLDANALAVRIDPEQDEAAAAAFDLIAYPTIVAIDKHGEEVQRLVGFRDGKTMREELARVLIAAPTGYKERLQLAERLRKDGDEAAALEHYLWLWDHGEEHNRGFGGVRVSFFLSQFAQFGKRYPPALQALEQRRDTLSQRVLGGDTSYDTVSDMVHLDRALGTTDRLSKVYEQVPPEKWAKERIARRVILRAVTEALVEARRYEQAASHLDDALADFEGELASPAMTILPDNLKRQMLARTIGQMRAPLEAWFGVKDDERTGSLVERLLGLKSDDETWMMILRAAKRAGHDVALHDYAVRALDELPEEDHARIRGLLKRR